MGAWTTSEENPFMRVPMVRREQKVVQPFSKDDLTTLLACLQSPPPSLCRLL